MEKNNIETGIGVFFVVFVIQQILSICTNIFPSMPQYVQIISQIIIAFIFSAPVVWFLREKGNQQDYFPKLNLPILENYAKRIIKKFSALPIEKIVLYRYSSKYFPEIMSKYAVLIFVNSTIKNSSELIEQFRALSFSTGWCASEHNLEFFHRLGMDAGFEEVYKQKPQNNFLDEWLFFAQLSDENIPVGVMFDETHIILFPKKNKWLSPSKFSIH